MENPITTVEAVFSGGMFRPLGEVALPENAHVRLTIQPIPPSAAEWLAATAALREEMFAKSGYYYDSAELVAADRRRDG